MAIIKHRSRTSANGSHAFLGKTPTPQQKIAHQANKMGLPGIPKMQGTGVNIYDTVLVTDSTTRQTLNFFNNTTSKSKTFSNWQAATFQAGETLAVTHMWLFWLKLSSANLTDATTITGIDILANSGTLGLTMGILNLSVANAVVLKNYNAFELMPQFNPEITGVTASWQTGTGTQYMTGTSRIRLRSNPVVTPNVAIQCTYEIPAISGSATNAAVMCVLGREGSIFNPQGTV